MEWCRGARSAFKFIGAHTCRLWLRLQPAVPDPGATERFIATPRLRHPNLSSRSRRGDSLGRAPGVDPFRRAPLRGTHWLYQFGAPAMRQSTLWGGASRPECHLMLRWANAGPPSQNGPQMPYPATGESKATRVVKMTQPIGPHYHPTSMSPSTHLLWHTIVGYTYPQKLGCR